MCFDRPAERQPDVTSDPPARRLVDGDPMRRQRLAAQGRCVRGGVRDRWSESRRRSIVPWAYWSIAKSTARGRSSTAAAATAAADAGRHHLQRRQHAPLVLGRGSRLPASADPAGVKPVSGHGRAQTELETVLQVKQSA